MRGKTFIPAFAFLLSVFIQPLSAQRVLEVPSQYKTIQAAINAAKDNDTILVAPGTYRENVVFNQNSVNLKSKGGAFETIIDGNKKGSVVAFPGGSGPGSTIDGFTITNGKASQGGGIWCAKGPAAITNNVIWNNEADMGGGVHCIGSGPVILNNTIVGNTAGAGSGIYVLFAYPTVTNCIVWNNGSNPKSEIYIPSIHPNPPITYCNIRGGWNGAGNINKDPLFLDETLGDFHLRYESPCRDKGTYRASVLLFDDFDKDPRTANGFPDIGADEFYPRLYVTGNLTTPNGLAHVKILGKPGTPTHWAYSLTQTVLDPPIEIPGMGKFYLNAPAFLVYTGIIPSTGIIILPVPLGPKLSHPMIFPMQALIGLQISNLYLASVK